MRFSTFLRRAAILALSFACLLVSAPAFAEDIVDAPKVGTDEIWDDAGESGKDGPPSEEGLGEVRNGVIRLNMGEVVALTLRNNLNVRTSYLDRVLEKFSLEQAEAKFQPTVNLDGSANLEAIKNNKRMNDHSKSAPAYNREAGLKSSVEQKIPTGATLTFSWDKTYKNNSSGTLAWNATNDRIDRTKTRSGGTGSVWKVDFTQPLLKGGGIDYNMASVQLARIQEKRNILNLRDNLSGLINEGINYFFTFVQAGENLDIQVQALDRSQRLVEVNKLKLKLGRMAESDVIQAEADEASQALSLEQARNSYDEARRNLLNHLNLDPELKVEPLKKGYREIKPDYDECMAMARKANRSYLDKIFSVTESETKYMMAENDRMWDLSLKGGYNEAHSHDSPGESYTDSELSVGLQLSAPINLWGEDYLNRKQALLQASADRRRAKIEMKKAETDLQTTVANAVRNVKMRLKFIGLSKRNTELKKAQLKNESVKLMAGRSTNFQVVTYQDQLVSAQQDEVANIISYLQALLDLDQILGTTMDTWKVEFRHEDTALTNELNDEVRPLIWTWW